MSFGDVFSLIVIILVVAACIAGNMGW
jgi:hypothetical protein